MASFHMVIYHADCLHIGIYDRTAYELKTTFFQIFADSVREWGSCGNLLFRSEMVADGLRKTRKAVSLEPMNPYERRIIHSALQGNRYVETYSEGNEPYRHVVVKLKK